VPPVSAKRLLALRALYALMAFGLGFVIWPQLLQPASPVPDPSTAVRALLGALGLMAAVGLRAPLQMLPVLLFELLWKTVWVGLVALPAWRQDQLGAYGTATLIECLPVFVLFPLVIPWRYVVARYLRHPAAP
jgi:hypothetical protein